MIDMKLTAASYHNLTSYERMKMGDHSLDWTNRPNVFKSYPKASKISLPGIREFDEVKKPLFPLFEPVVHSESKDFKMTVDDLAKILVLTQTITAKSQGGATEFFFRSAASAGALYPTEIYAVSAGIAELKDGIYHYSISDHSLEIIREGRFLSIEPGEACRAVFIFTAIFFRSSWKYRDRAYRYNLMDTGHVIENQLLALKAMGLSHKLSYDFDDKQVNRLLGLDENLEAALAFIDIPGKDLQLIAPALKTINPLAPSFKEASLVARIQKQYEMIAQIHSSAEQIRNPSVEIRMMDHTGLNLKAIKGTPWINERIPAAGYPEAVFLRRSKRDFADEPVDHSTIAGLIASLRAENTPCICTGLLIGSANGCSPGFYLVDQTSGKPFMASDGYFNEKMADICLHQLWLAKASLHFIILSNLALLDEAFGARGYRYALMSAGRMGQRIYLAATSLGLGCCGIGAFYDHEAARLLGLDDDTRLLYLLAAGKIRK
ncbi:MAG: SagB/ThcOx family dehydrogenase [Desulfobacteraceae bacterium]|nr:MAG: SagB/ThcOx family dehydrogenase [Desulfobacteraceae bacterium]